MSAALDSWAAPESLREWIRANLDPGSTILELGSGAGTDHLAEQYQMWSVEHDPFFVGRYRSKYIHAKIKNGWYSKRTLEQELPRDYDLILVDGPPGSIGRAPFAENLDLFNTDVPIVFDDTHRRAEYYLTVAVGLAVGRSPDFRTTSDGRGFAIV